MTSGINGVAMAPHGLKFIQKVASTSKELFEPPGSPQPHFRPKDACIVEGCLDSRRMPV